MKSIWNVIKILLSLFVVFILLPILGSYIGGELRGALGLPRDGKI